jgi:hypothetical protein
MKRKSFVIFLALLAVSLVSRGDEPIRKTKAPSVRDLADRLDETIALADFAKPMPLNEALSLLQAKLKSRNKDLPIRLNHEAFEEENPDAEKVSDTPIRFPAILKQLRVSQALRFMVGQVKTHNGTYLIRPGYVEITTIEQAGLPHLLGQGVHVRFRNRSLALALEDLYDLTGVPVILDPRAGRLAQLPITANFTNNATLGTVLVLLSEMAGLKLLEGDNTLYITTAAHARQFLLERAMSPGYDSGPYSPYSPFSPRLKRIEAAE